MIASGSFSPPSLHEKPTRTVCFCNSNIPWGGGENWHLNAADSLARRGYRVLVLCHPFGELHARARRMEHITVVPLPIGRFSFLNPLLRARLVRLFRKERVDALIMNLPSDLKTAGPAARFAGVRHVIYRRGSALPVRNTVLNRYLFGRVITRLIVNSEATRALTLVNNPNLTAGDRITILPNGINVHRFDQALALAEGMAEQHMRDGESEGPSPFFIGTAGRLTLQKGQHLLLHLGRRLADAGLDCRILIAGQGEREKELKALADRLGMRGRVEFCGFMPDLAPFWRRIQLFVLPSLWEGFGNVIIEAMLARKPVFAFAVSNIPELVTDGVTGRLFPLPHEERRLCPEEAHPDAVCPPTPNSSARRGEAAGGPYMAPESPRQKDAYAELDLMVAPILELAARPEIARRMGEAGRAFAMSFSQEARMDELEELLR